MNKRTAPILLLTFVNALGGTLLIPVLPFVVRDLGQSDFVFALLIAAYPAAQFFAAPILGSVADHAGRRPVLLVSQAGTLFSWVLFAIAYFVGDGAALALIAASRIVDGLTGGNASVAAAYLADVTTDDERTRVFSFQGAIAGVALLIGPALGSFSAATSIGFLGPALLATAISVATLVWMALTLDESLAAENRRPELDLNPLHQLNLLSRARHLTGRGPLGRLFGVQAAFTMAFSGYTTILVLWYVDRLGVSEANAGLLLLAVGAFLIFNEMVTLRLVEKALGDVGTLAAGLTLLPVSLVIVRIPTSVGWFLAASFVVNVAMALTMPTLQSVITRAADDREEGEVQGINTSVAAIASTVAPIAAGATYASRGGSTTILLAAATAALAAVVILISLRTVAAAADDELPHISAGWLRWAHPHKGRHHGPIEALAMRRGRGHDSFCLEFDAPPTEGAAP